MPSKHKDPLKYSYTKHRNTRAGNSINQKSSNTNEPPGNGKAVASIAIGIVSFVLIWFKLVTMFMAPIITIMLIAGIWLSISNKRDNEIHSHPTFLPTVALMLNIVLLVLNFVTLISYVACTACMSTIGLNL